MEKIIGIEKHAGKVRKGIFLAYHQSSKRELGRMSGKYLPWELVKYKVR